MWRKRCPAHAPCSEDSQDLTLGTPEGGSLSPAGRVLLVADPAVVDTEHAVYRGLGLLMAYKEDVLMPTWAPAVRLAVWARTKHQHWETNLCVFPLPGKTAWRMAGPLCVLSKDKFCVPIICDDAAVTLCTFGRHLETSEAVGEWVESLLLSGCRMDWFRFVWDWRHHVPLAAFNKYMFLYHDQLQWWGACCNAAFYLCTYFSSSLKDAHYLMLIVANHCRSVRRCKAQRMHKGGP